MGGLHISIWVVPENFISQKAAIDIQPPVEHRPLLDEMHTTDMESSASDYKSRDLLL